MDICENERSGKFKELREKYGTFTYKSYTKEKCDGKIKITYRFEIESLAVFSPSWIFDNKAQKNDMAADRLIFYLGMVELISYWKCACPPKVIIEAGHLSDDEIEWWKKLYFDGLGEFFYVNSIAADMKSFMEIISTGKNPVPADFSEETGEKGEVRPHGVLIPVGGGKDSVVTMEIINGMKKEGLIDRSEAFIINPRGATIHTAREAGYTDPLTVKRTLDAELLNLNAKGFLNGHTPFSAIVAFASTLAAHFNGFDHVALSNESSANESTVMNTNINHQYSKGFEFERAFAAYEKKHIKSGVTYFSLLRPMSELQIAGIFARHKKYHKLFKSCNAGSKSDIWCAKCPKCLFVYIILSPFLAQEELMGIFGANMAEDESMIENFDKLTGAAAEKPFECVGSRGEVNAAVAAAIIKIEDDGKKLPLLLRRYKEAHPFGFPESIETYRDYFDEENALPEIFKERLIMLLNADKIGS